MKCGVCEKPANHIAFFLYRVDPTSPLMKFETPLHVCEDHANNVGAEKLASTENFVTINQVLREKGYTMLDKRRLSVGFAPYH